VTSNQVAEAHNFGRPGVDNHQVRYGRAQESIEVCKGLWDSWDDDAFIRDTQSGLYFKPESMHTLNHKGTTYNVRGPLNVPRPPQGYPVIVQAGASDEGRELAAQQEARRHDVRPGDVVVDGIGLPNGTVSVLTNHTTTLPDDPADPPIRGELAEVHPAQDLRGVPSQRDPGEPHRVHGQARAQLTGDLTGSYLRRLRELPGARREHTEPRGWAHVPRPAG